MFKWALGQSRTILFVIADSASAEVTGLGSSFSLEISKNGSAFVPGEGVKAEMSRGWYSYTNTPEEADTPGEVAIVAWGTGSAQQNIPVLVERTSGEGDHTFTYTVTVDGGAPCPNCMVWVSPTSADENFVCSGITDAHGDVTFSLDTGTYYFWRRKSGVNFQNPEQVTTT